MKTRNIYAWMALALLGLSASCSESDDEQYIAPEQPDAEVVVTPEKDLIPNIDTTIVAWNGEMADDASLDAVGEDKDIYHENTTWKNTVTITFDEENGTTIEGAPKTIQCEQEGDYVTLNLKSVANTEIILKGKSNNGGLKVYSNVRYKLTLDGVELTSQKGPAINNQGKEAIFIHAQEGTVNTLTDAQTYETDNSEEDRKGCLFSEGSLSFSGTGVLKVAGKNKHAIATDHCLYIRPGVTLVVTEAAKTALQVKGDDDDNTGVYIGGGLIHAYVTSTAGRGIKTDNNVEIAGGKLMLNVTGDSGYDEEDMDTSSPACIKAGKKVLISGGMHTLKSGGMGGKGLNVTGDLQISGGKTTVVNTGVEYVYAADTDKNKSAKGVNTDGNITITGDCKLTVYTTRVDTEGIDAGGNLTIGGGETYVHAYDDAVKAKANITMNGGQLFAYSVANDGISPDGTLTINDGVVIGVGEQEQSGIDIDTENGGGFVINGGGVVSTGGVTKFIPYPTNGTQCFTQELGKTVKGTLLCILNGNNEPVVSFELPRTYEYKVSLFANVPELVSGGSYTLKVGGKLTGNDLGWNGWYPAGGTWSE